jgi:hypothetical protein
MNLWTKRTIGATLALALCSVAAVQAQGYNNGPAPSGSYLQSCQNIRVRGNMLRADCQQTNGQYVPTRLSLNRCGGGDIANDNGRLTCARIGGYGRGNGYYGRGQGYYNGGAFNGMPGGSYQQSCRNIQMNGSVLTASCTNYHSQYVQSYLDISRCTRSDDIANVNGQLRCMYQ